MGTISTAGSRFRDVTKIYNPSIFGLNTSKTINFTNINTEGGKWIEIANQGAAPRNLTGWKLASGGKTTFTFPTFTLEAGVSSKIHEGNGVSTKADLYTNSTEPLWNDGVIILFDESGNQLASYQVPTKAIVPSTSKASSSKAANPLDNLIQY